MSAAIASLIVLISRVIRQGIIANEYTEAALAKVDKSLEELMEHYTSLRF
jgi:hypothetical protein